MIIKITPCPAPRQVRSDVWRPSPSVQRYRAFKDELRLKAKMFSLVVPDSVRLKFVLPMPDSWPLRKKMEMNFQPHRAKPDVDNLVKAFLDALLSDDSHVYEVHATKHWGMEGSIDIDKI